MALFRRKKKEDLTQASRGNASTEMEGGSPDFTAGLPVRHALSLFYYLMAADGELHDDEMEKFDAIYEGLDGPEYINQKVLVHKCQSRLDTYSGPTEPIMRAISCADRILYSPTYFDLQEMLVPPKLLVWDLLAIAYSDGGCPDSERSFINHVANAVGVEDELLLEMENYMLTILDLEVEEAWIKTTSQPYAVIESVLNDLQVRKEAVFDGTYALIDL